MVDFTHPAQFMTIISVASLIVSALSAGTTGQGPTQQLMT